MDYEGYIKASNTPISLLKDILERKWTSIARLKKQVMDLERMCKQLKETNEQHQSDLQNFEKQVASGAITSQSGLDMFRNKGGDEENKNQSGDALPREPEKSKL